MAKKLLTLISNGSSLVFFFLHFLALFSVHGSIQLSELNYNIPL